MRVLAQPTVHSVRMHDAWRLAHGAEPVASSRMAIHPVASLGRVSQARLPVAPYLASVYAFESLTFEV
jgi:hypothetical protein